MRKSTEKEMARIKEDFQKSLTSSILVLILVFPSGSSSCVAKLLRRCKFDSVYQLGDSLADTGNRVIENASTTRCSQYPYGETYFNEPTGRCSNGLLVIDYVALESGLPLLNPYLKKGSDFSNGVNFAVAGATALPTSTLSDKGVMARSTNSSLHVQLDWMSTFFSTTTTTGHGQELKDALFLVGEIGGNDFNYAFLQGKTIQEAKSFVPDVVQVITHAVRRVIEHGGRRVVVPGNFPIGCMPSLLTAFRTNDTAAYDEFKCLKELNDFAEYFNERLHKAIIELRNENLEDNIVILYADYYNAFKWLLRNARSLGFEDGPCLVKTCCGVGGEYNFDGARQCGTPGVEACPDPNRFISWDGIHLTQKAYILIAKWIIHHIFPHLCCN